MSLLRVRRKRKREWIDIQKGKSPGALIFLLALVVVLIWYLHTRF
jgi:hypothetical protein